MRKFSGPYDTIEDALDQSEAAMRAIADARGVAYPVPPSRGGPLLSDPSIAYATHATEVREDKDEKFWIGHTPEIEALPDVTKRVGRGRNIRVERTGQERGPADWAEREIGSLLRGGDKALAR